MMTRGASVVTPQRFAQGLTYQEFLSQAKVNVDQFNRWYQEFQLKPQDAAFFRQAAQAGASRVLVLGEDWCPDACRGLPVVAHIAEAAGIELRVFPRDANLDIMDEFLNQGQFRSIPAVVFYTDKQDYLCHWVERPKVANEELTRIEAEVKQEIAGASEQDQRAEIRKRTTARYAAWQRATVQELKELLAACLKLR